MSADVATDFTLVAADGCELAATVYGRRQAETALIVNGATGVPRHFYRAFATHLVRRNWAVLTFDYRGIGDSAPRSLRGFDAGIRDWALHDMPAAIDWVGETLSPKRVFAIGHSFGGQTLGLCENAGRIDAMVAVSAQSGYWGVQPGAERLRVGVAVNVIIPLLTRVIGYFPWRWFASAEDLPRNVALEWARWCRQRNYLLDDTSLPLHRYKDFEAPVLAYSIDDDGWGSSRSVDEMMHAYVNVTRRHLIPAEYRLERLGHMGAFRRGSEGLWDEFAGWLDAQ